MTDYWSGYQDKKDILIFFSQKHFHKKVYYKYRISHTAVLVVINVLTRGIGVIVVVVGAVGFTSGTSEKRISKRRERINFDHSWLI